MTTGAATFSVVEIAGTTEAHRQELWEIPVRVVFLKDKNYSEGFPIYFLA